MVNAQEWLNKKYPTFEIKAKVVRISPKSEMIIDNISSLEVSRNQDPMAVFLNMSNLASSMNDTLNQIQIEGSLSLEGFTDLTTLDVSGQRITSLDLTGCTKLEEFNCSNNQLINLNLSNCKQLKNLNCSANRITTLNLSSSPKIVQINCSNNQLTSLVLSAHFNFPTSGGSFLSVENDWLNEMGLSPINRLENFDCSNNQLVDLEFLEKIHDAYYLKKLNIGNNNLPPTDIEKIKAFSFLINLEILNIGTDDQERLSQRIYNRFYGSLKAL